MMKTQTSKIKKKRSHYFIPFLVLLVVAPILWHSLSIKPRHVPSPFINKPAPAINLPDLLSPGHRLTNRMFQGHVSLLNVWASWCVECAIDHPLFMEIANKDNIPIYGLNYKDNKTEAINWLNSYGNPYDAIGNDPKGTTAINWGVYGTPETFIIDKNGIIRFKVIGHISENFWHGYLRPLITKLNAGETL